MQDYKDRGKTKMAMQLADFFKFIIAPYQGFSKDTWRLLISGFINSMALIIVIYISLYLNSLGYTITEIGFVLTLFGLFGVAGAYCGGVFTNHMSAISICKLSLLLSGILFFLFAFLSNYYIMLLVVGLLGFSANMFRPAFILVLAAGENKGSLESIAALRRVAINLGMSIGAGMSGFLASLNFSFVFYFNAISSIVAFFILLSIKERKQLPEKRDHILQNTNRNSRPTFYFMILSMFLVLLVFNQSDATYPLFLKNQLFINEKYISLLFTLSGVMIACFQVPITNIFRNKNTNWVCALGAFLVCLGFLILPWATSGALITLSCILWTVGEIIFFPAQLAMVIRLSGENKGRSMGIYQMVFSLASFLSPALGSTIYAYNQNILWYLCGLAGIIVVFSFLLSEKTTSKLLLSTR
jgi:predicted MFS family arabinose efflux permease